MRFSRGERLYKYELQSYIGGGNFGEVWLASDITLDAVCALKLLTPNNISIDERLLEAKIGNRLQHTNVITIKYADIININESNQQLVVIAMPYFEQGSVLSLLNSKNFLDIKSAVMCLIDVLRGLEYLHENGYFHCDIKPNNILVGNSGEYVLSDYGITCYSPSHLAVQPRQCYLPHISPETLTKNEYDERTDIYQLGLTAFRLINGICEIKDEFNKSRENFEQMVLQGKLITDSKYQPHVPRKIRRIIMKASANDPNERYQTALEMRRDLESISLKGTCTSDVNGNIIIENDNYTYRYEIHPITAKTSDFVAFKKNQKSGRETKVLKYCANAITKKEIKKLILNMSTDLL